MTDRYLPPSDFLNCVAHGEVVLDDSKFGQHNLNRLLAMVTDQDRANRDWAAFLISGLPIDTPSIREALLLAAQDVDEDARDEALVGLARRDRDAATRLIAPLLVEDVSNVLLEAAGILGREELVPALEAAQASGAITEKMKGNWETALSACKAGMGVDVDINNLTEQHRLDR